MFLGRARRYGQHFTVLFRFGVYGLCSFRDMSAFKGIQHVMSTARLKFNSPKVNVNSQEDVEVLSYLASFMSLLPRAARWE